MSNEHPVACQPSDLHSFEVWVVAKYGRLRLCEVELFTEPLPTVTQVAQWMWVTRRVGRPKWLQNPLRMGGYGWEQEAFDSGKAAKLMEVIIKHHFWIWHSQRKMPAKWEP